jgi:hypothetical protein
LKHLDGYASQASILSMGWQSSAKVAIDNSNIGLEYRGKLSRVGEGTSLFDQSLALRHVPGQLAFVVEFAL